MVYQGRVEKGVVVLEGDVKLPEGTRVHVEPQRDEAAGPIDSLATTLLKHAGTVNSWPADMARNHDHYLHGAPKRD